ncbi:hypothetical protein Q9F39_001360 [Vibrio fluvialis]|nr:hypothetical protein [Vibrio fluvialis]
MRRPLTKTVEFMGAPMVGGFMASFFVDGSPVVDVFFDSAFQISETSCDYVFCLGNEVVMIEDKRLYDLFCEFRKQDEAPEVLTVDGADSSPQCTQGGAA